LTIQLLQIGDTTDHHAGSLWYARRSVASWFASLLLLSISWVAQESTHRTPEWYGAGFRSSGSKKKGGEYSIITLLTGHLLIIHL